MGRPLLVYGAGAIGRGFLPWVFPPGEYDYHYGETNPALRAALLERGRFRTHRVVDGAYESLEVPVAGCFEPGSEDESVLAEAAAVITAVGPRNALALAEPLSRTAAPVICCENDAGIPAVMATASGKPNVVFGIPDVITSNTASPELLAEDPLSIVTEDGVCFVDASAAAAGGACRYVERAELERQWRAKLYVHNTPHAVAAYLGALAGVQYLHEAMQIDRIRAIVAGTMEETAQMLELRFGLDREFVRWYADKELRRFTSPLLYDPINRVAREPFRKLGHRDRLLGAANLCLGAGVVPENLLLGIISAFAYDNEHDPDFNIRHLMHALEPTDFLSIIIRLRPAEALSDLLLERWDDASATLRSIQR